MISHLPLPPWIMPSHRESNAEASRAEGGAHPRTSFALVNSDELPPWFTPYPFVKTGYRVHFSGQADPPHPPAPFFSSFQRTVAQATSWAETSSMTKLDCDSTYDEA